MRYFFPVKRYLELDPLLPEIATAGVQAKAAPVNAIVDNTAPVRAVSLIQLFRVFILADCIWLVLPDGIFNCLACRDEGIAGYRPAGSRSPICA